MALPKPKDDFELDAISPRLEMGAYEALWLREKATFKTVADLFREHPGALPSSLVGESEAETTAQRVFETLKKEGVHRFGVRVHGAGDYPAVLRDAKNPVELLYYRGTWELASTPCVAIVGTRNPTNDGASRAYRVARLLVENGYTIVSGLAAGIDTIAHRAAIEAGGRTIAVIGTHIGQSYPRENEALQQQIAAEHLLVSQVPVLRSEQQDYRINRLYFPERNKTMSALTHATIIIEAGETSGTLTQAQAALYQGRGLMILDSLFRRDDLTWPTKFERRGAIRVRSDEDIIDNLPAPADQD